jgi:endonuclease/exonuclease/phosphatase family metal-dependent hydrolase
MIFADRWGWLYVLNMLAVYLALPSLFFVLVAFFVQRKETWVGLGLVMTIWVMDFGGLFVPRINQPNDDMPVLRVMTYNVLGLSADTEAILFTIRSADADLIAFQELYPEAGTAIQRELQKQYPFQILDAREYVFGAGVISRYPLYPMEYQLEGDWLGDPQVLTLAFEDERVTIVNAHTYATSFVGKDLTARYKRLERTNRERENQARTLAEFAGSTQDPLIVLMDLNVGDQTKAYHIVTHELRDIWYEGGWGLGHTYSPASELGLSSPLWILRLDYVLCSDHWGVGDAFIGPWDGVSDHRPVGVDLYLLGQ